LTPSKLATRAIMAPSFLELLGRDGIYAYVGPLCMGPFRTPQAEARAEGRAVG
jgi:hypothetical protein